MCLGLAVVALALRVGMSLAGAPMLAIYQYTFTRMDALTLGAAGAVVARDRASLAWLAPRLPRAVAAAAAATLVMVPMTHGFSRDNFWVKALGYGLVSLVSAGLVLLAAVDPGSRAARGLRVRWLQWFGKYSYAIYVFHYPIARVLHPRFVDAVNQPDGRRGFAALLAYATVVLASSSAAAVVSWNLLERWALQLKDRWAPRPRGDEVPGAASSSDAVATRQAS